MNTTVTNPLLSAKVEIAISRATLASVVITCALIFITFFAIRKLAATI